MLATICCTKIYVQLVMAQHLQIHNLFIRVFAGIYSCKELDDTKPQQIILY